MGPFATAFTHGLSALTAARRADGRVAASRVSGTAHGFGSVLSVFSVACCESNGPKGPEARAALPEQRGPVVEQPEAVVQRRARQLQRRGYHAR